MTSILTADEMKLASAREAMKFVEKGKIIGIGTGSTANHFIRLLGEIKEDIPGAVASSNSSAKLLEEVGIKVFSLNEAGQLYLYVDGADEVDGLLHLIKGGGGALTREKIVAQRSDRFVCICDQSKLVETLGAFPLPIEVIPMAEDLVISTLAGWGFTSKKRADFITDNGNIIVDVEKMTIIDPVSMEEEINQIPGVVTVGLFARRSADILILGTPDGCKVFD
jgi:ribose 5-phosphate isomerase A